MYMVVVVNNYSEADPSLCSETVTKSYFCFPNDSGGCYFVFDLLLFLCRAASGSAIGGGTCCSEWHFAGCAPVQPSNAAAKCRMLYARAHHNATHCALTRPRTVICPSPR